MKKPQNLAGQNGVVLQLQTKLDYIEVFDARLAPNAARKMAARLLKMADYLEKKIRQAEGGVK